MEALNLRPLDYNTSLNHLATLPSVVENVTLRDIPVSFCIIMLHPDQLSFGIIMLHPFVVWHNYVTSICLFTLCSPDTQTYIQKLEKEKRDKAAGQTQDNRSFLAKYVSI